MKHTILFILFSLSAILCFGQTTTSNTQINGPKISFDNTVHDFGMIAYNGPGTHVYIVTNTGTEPLIILNCIKGCGCTEVNWTKDPILPGQKGMVKATYNTKKLGDFSRGVDVYSNDPSNPKINIRLKGSVAVVTGGETPPVVTSTKPPVYRTPTNEKW